MQYFINRIKKAKSSDLGGVCNNSNIKVTAGYFYDWRLSQTYNGAFQGGQRAILGSKRSRPPSKNPKKCPILCFAPDKKIISRTFKIIGIFTSQRKRERGRERERERERKRKRERESKRGREREGEKEKSLELSHNEFCPLKKNNLPHFPNQRYINSYNSPKGQLVTYYPAEFKIARENRYIRKICMILKSAECTLYIGQRDRK